MTFKTWLENTDNTRSWLDTAGHFHPIGNMSHSDWSSAQGFQPEELFQRGWLRVAWYGGSILTSNYANIRPNARQVSSLIALAQDNPKFTEIYFDNGETERSIWSRDAIH